MHCNRVFVMGACGVVVENMYLASGCFETRKSRRIRMEVDSVEGAMAKEGLLFTFVN